MKQTLNTAVFLLIIGSAVATCMAEQIIQRPMKGYEASLKQSFAEKPIDKLIKTLDSDIPYFRWCAAEALSKKEGTSSVAALVEALNSPSWRVRRGACDGLSMAVNRVRREMAAKPTSEAHKIAAANYELVRGCAPDLVAMLADDHFWVREGAARLMGLLKMSTPAAVEALHLALDDPDKWVRETATRTLAAIGATATPAEDK